MGLKLRKFNFMAELHNEDIVALSFIVAYIVVKVFIKDTSLDNIMVLLGGYYFGTATQKRANNLE